MAGRISPRAITSCLCEPLEGRLLFALAAAADPTLDPGYSGTLSSNKSIRKQQLICDPAEPLRGSTSVLYDASLVTLTGAIPGPGYDNLGFIGLIELRKKNGTTELHPLVAFLSQDKPPGVETGYVQISYKLTGQAGQIAPPSDYTVIQEDGVQGVDTHAFFFDLKKGVTDLDEVKYQIYAERANVHSNNQEDGLTTTDGIELGPDDLSPAFVTSNFAPVITSTTAPATIAEGDGLTMSATATDVEADQGAQTLTYTWEIKNGPNSLTLNGASVTPTTAQLTALGLTDGLASANVKLTVSDGSKTDVETFNVAVTNVAPTASITGAPAAVIVGSAVNLGSTVTDPAITDTYTYAWSVDGGATAGTGSTFSFTPTSAGTAVVSLTVTDDDGGVSSTVNKSVTVNPLPPPPPPPTGPSAELCPDPAYPSQLALCVTGTAGDDVIGFYKSGKATGVSIGSATFGPFTGFNRIIVRGLAGNDTVTLNYNAASEVVFFGGEGNDSLHAGNFQSILIGGAGDDLLRSGNAKDLLIGGDGADDLGGGGGDDLLVGGQTSYDAGTDTDVIAVSRIMQEWTSGGSLISRVNHITGETPGGLNGSYIITSLSDGDDDLLDGGTGTNGLITD